MINIEAYKEQVFELLRNQDPIEHKRVTEILLKFPSKNAWQSYPTFPLIRKIRERDCWGEDNIMVGFVLAWDVKKVFLGSQHLPPGKVVLYEDLNGVLDDGWLADV